MKNILFACISIALCSCSSMHYGNLTNTSVKKDEYLARDALNRISKLKVPARTTLKVYQKSDNVFGHELLALLRQQGYGIQENVRSDNKSNFHYVVDKLDSDDDVRVSLYIDSEQLSRAYHISGKSISPIDAWSHKE